MGMSMYPRSMDNLVAEHHALDAQVRALAKRAYLSQAEQLEEVELKKKRLRAKDEMRELQRER
jgi:uncharacterized protein YdcH (DUF465 family)